MADHKCTAHEMVGWGNEDVTFSDADKPKLGRTSGRAGLGRRSSHTTGFLWEIDLPTTKMAVHCGVGWRPINYPPPKRIVGAAGKAFRDLFRLRRGQVDFAPDLVVYPVSEEDVVSIVKAAHEPMVLIPFRRLQHRWLFGTVAKTDSLSASTCARIGCWR